MDKPITFVEQTIPTLTIQYFTPSQSHDSLLSSSQSDQGLYLTTESAESISTTSYYTGIDRDSEDSEKGNCNTGSEISENELIEQNREELQEADMTLEINKLNSAEDYHKELPCLKIIIDDFDKQKFNGDINSNLVVKDDSSDNKTCKWHEVSEKELNAYEGSNITPPPSTWLNPLEEPATSTLEHSHIDQTTDTPNSRELPNRCAEPDQSLSGNDLEKLKLLATRLKLQTRRGSYTMWRDKLSQAVSSPTSRQPSTRHTSDSHDTQSSIHTSDSLSTSNRLQEKLQFLRDELKELRDQDVSLARQFMSLRADIQQVRLQHTSIAVHDMVDEAQWTIAEKTELEHVWDEPHCIDRTPLLTVGVTKMNLTERRFSVF